MSKNHQLFLWVFLLIFGCALSTVTAADEPPNLLNIQFEPQQINLGTFYNGMEIAVHGLAPQDNDIIVRFIGDKQDIHLNRKGKTLGLLWMNTGAVTIKNAPAASIIYSTRDFKTMAGSSSPAASDVWKLDHSALQGQIEMDPPAKDAEEKEFLSHELVRLKEHDNLFAEVPGGVTISGLKKGRESFEARIRIPSSIRPGNYRLEAYAFQNGKLIDSISRPVQAKMAGLPSFMYKMAYHQALVYGLLATIIAIAGGLLMSLIFGVKKGAH